MRHVYRDLLGSHMVLEQHMAGVACLMEPYGAEVLEDMLAEVVGQM